MRPAPTAGLGRRRTRPPWAHSGRRRTADSWPIDSDRSPQIVPTRGATWGRPCRPASHAEDNDGDDCQQERGRRSSAGSTPLPSIQDCATAAAPSSPPPTPRMHITIKKVRRLNWNRRRGFGFCIVSSRCRSDTLIEGRAALFHDSRTAVYRPRACPRKRGAWHPTGRTA